MEQYRNQPLMLEVAAGEGVLGIPLHCAGSLPPPIPVRMARRKIASTSAIPFLLSQ